MKVPDIIPVELRHARERFRRARLIPRRHLVVSATFLLSVLLYVDRACISTAKEPMVSELGLSDQQWGWVMASFAFGYALLQTPAGALADRFGGRRVLAAVVAFWSIFTGLTAGAWNFVSLLVVRFLFGAGEAGAFPGNGARGVLMDTRAGAWPRQRHQFLRLAAGSGGDDAGAAVDDRDASAGSNRSSS